jgi:mxaJ protein
MTVRWSAVAARRAVARLVPVAAWVVASLVPTLSVAQSPAAGTERKALRVCQDPSNLPFSNTAKEGIENKFAEIMGKSLGLPVTYYEFPARMNFIRNTLRYKLPGEDFRCDIVLGVPVGFDQVAVTKPIYRSTYALVLPAGKGFDGVKNGADFLALGKDKLGKLRIGVIDRSPASAWLNKHGLVEQGVPFQMLNADPVQYPGEIVEKELASGKIDAAIMWGPIAGFFAKRVKEPKLIVVPLTSEPGVKFDFEMAMGVRYGERAWKEQVETLIETHRNDFRAVLESYGVPLVSEGGAPLR